MNKHEAIAWVKDQTVGHRRRHLWWFLLPRWWRERRDVCWIEVEWVVGSGDESGEVRGGCRVCEWECGTQYDPEVTT